jgi:CheY-like chemotaxis protein
MAHQLGVFASDLQGVMSHEPSLRILLVEDDVDLLGLAAAMLGSAGHQVVTAASAEDARTLVPDAADVDAVVTDIVLPGASGVDLASELVASRPDLPVVYVTGQSDPAVHERLRATGHPLLLKPYTADSLGDALRVARVRAAGGAGDLA